MDCQKVSVVSVSKSERISSHTLSQPDFTNQNCYHNNNLSKILFVEDNKGIKKKEGKIEVNQSPKLTIQRRQKVLTECNKTEQRN
jgi:hypothetical protein